MHRSLRFTNLLKQGYVCKLHRALYGLKQAPWAWYHRFHTFLITQGFRPSQCDISLFIRHASAHTIFVLVYVNDLIVTSNNLSIINWFINQLCYVFYSRQLGDLGFFLGMEILCTDHSLRLTQIWYAADLLKRFNMLGCKPCSRPIASYPRLSAHNGTAISDVTEYRSMVGGLQYLILTRPGIAFAVNQVYHIYIIPIVHIFKLSNGFFGISSTLLIKDLYFLVLTILLFKHIPTRIGQVTQIIIAT